MGNLNAMGMAEAVTAGHANLDEALAWHLGANHYPPVPRIMVGPCKRAIAATKAFERDGKVRNVRLPKGVMYRGKNLVSAGTLVDALHLDPFIEG